MVTKPIERRRNGEMAHVRDRAARPYRFGILPWAGARRDRLRDDNVAVGHSL